MWIAKLIEKKYNKGQEKIEVEIEYTDGVNIINKIYKITDPNREVLKKIILDKIQNLDELENLNNTLVKGEIDLTKIPVIPTILPDNEKVFIEDLDLFRRLKNAVDLRLIQTDDNKFVNIKTRVITALKDNPSWIK